MCSKYKRCIINYSTIHSILCCTAAQVVGFDSVWGKNKVRRRRRSPCLAFVIGMVMVMIYLVMRKRMILFVVTGMSECPKKILWIFSPYRPTHILSYKLMLAFTSTLSGGKQNIGCALAQGKQIVLVNWSKDH